MNIEDLTTINQVIAFLEGTQRVAFEVADDKDSRYRWVQRTLVKFHYLSLSRPDKGVLIRYLMKISGYSRQQITRLIKQYRDTGRLVRQQRTANGFSRRFTAADIRLLAAMDERHSTPNGLTMKKLCERAYTMYGQPTYQRLASISVAHLYNLRKATGYVRYRRHVEKTRPRSSRIGERRKPRPNGQPGYIRIDTVHQGDWDGQKGVYHVNAVDEVTQVEMVVSVEKISERYLIPALEQLLDDFPFIIQGFHSDNGSEYVNGKVAGLLEKLRVEFTKSRSRKTNDNALAESKNGHVVRKIFGHDHIPQRWAAQINEFNRQHLNPYINYHRPCLFPEMTTDSKGKQRKRYPYDAIKTPYEKLKSLPGAAAYLKPGLSFEILDAIAHEQSDNEAADKLQKARRQLFNQSMNGRRKGLEMNSVQPSFRLIYGLENTPVKRRKVTANFNGGDITGNGGLLLLRKIDRLTGLTKQVAKRLADDRVRGRCEHTQLSLLRQRVYALAIGDEDLNDHQQLRHDLALQSAIDRDQPLASPSTLCRWENAATGGTARTIHEVMVDQFIASFEKPPTRLVLDVDATDDPVHGMQEHRGFHAYYDHYCFLPLYVFCGEKLLVSYLRPSRIDGAKHSWAILALLTKRLRQVWPKVKLIVRGDSGFCRWRMLNWFDHHDVGYVIGMARNDRLNHFAGRLIRKAERDYQQTGQKQRLFGEFRYGAGSWPYPRRVIAKAEHSSRGSNPRYLVTNLTQSPQYLYDKLYCLRGDMENRIKEQQLGLFADRTSCHRWWPNQFRLLLSSLAYVLMQRLRDIGLRGTGYAKAQVGTIRLTLLKIGAVIIRNTRRVKFFLSSAYPHQQLFCQVVARLDTS